jgi:SAM-dependent methyltransferase
MAKQYDRAYFDRWYRREGFGSKATLERKVRFAFAAAEYLLQRPVRSVLDVGCGEGQWQPKVRSLRPAARYVGVDPSRYAVDRYGRRRNLRLGGIGELSSMALGGPFDLIVCVDVLPYVTNIDARRGLRAVGALLDGVALIEAFTSADDFEGDLHGYRRRTPSTYRRWFSEAGLEHIGPNLFAGAGLLATLSSFEQGLGQLGG